MCRQLKFWEGLSDFILIGKFNIFKSQFQQASCYTLGKAVDWLALGVKLVYPSQVCVVRGDPRSVVLTFECLI